MPKAKIIGKNPRQYQGQDGSLNKVTVVYYTYAANDRNAQGEYADHATIPDHVCRAEDIHIGDLVIVAKTSRTWNGQTRDVLDTYEILQKAGDKPRA